MSKKSQKYCIVPLCFNSTVKTPDKLFFNVPNDPEMRKKWMTAARRADPIGPKTKAECCEDHFDVEKDMENYIKYKYMGMHVRLKLRRDVVPHRFACQNRSVDKLKPESSVMGKLKRVGLKTAVCDSTSVENIGPTLQTSSQILDLHLSMDSASAGSEGPSEPEDGDEIEVKLEPEDDVQRADPLTSSVECASYESHTESPVDPLQPLNAQQPATNAVVKVEIEGIEDETTEIEDEAYKEMFFKLQQEMEILKADNQRLLTENHNLAKEIHNLKQTNDNETVTLKDIEIVSRDNKILQELANVYQYADKIRNITSRYKIDEENQNENVNGQEILGNLTEKLRSLIEVNKNIITERDTLKDKVQNLLMDLESEYVKNKSLKRNVKLRSRIIEKLRIKCVNKSRTIRRLKTNCVDLRSVYMYVKMARQHYI